MALKAEKVDVRSGHGSGARTRAKNERTRLERREWKRALKDADFENLALGRAPYGGWLS